MDLKQVFDMAVAEGFLLRNPAQLLFTPRQCPRAAARVMTIEEVRTVFGVLDVREQRIARLAIVAGTRPGEIFALTWQRLEAQYADIIQRIYRGDVDPEKYVLRPSGRPFRWPAYCYRGVALFRSRPGPRAWVFPSNDSPPLAARTTAGGGISRRS
jgi:integrase